jgi:hypothetical protein
MVIEAEQAVPEGLLLVLLGHTALLSPSSLRFSRKYTRRHALACAKATMARLLEHPVIG